MTRRGICVYTEGMEEKEDLLQKLDKGYAGFSKGQKKLADYIRSHFAQAAFLTAAKLGEMVGVSESTVIRFSYACGYNGYPAFQKAMGDMVQGKFSSLSRMDFVYAQSSEGDILHSVLQTDEERIQETLKGMDQDTFRIAVDLILHAKKVYVIGLRSCAPLAEFLQYYLQLACDNVVLINGNGSSEIFEQLIRIGERDVIIGISFPRYSTRTLQALEYATNKNAKVITLTDSVNSPITLYSSCNLIAKSEMASIVDSLTAALSVINALVVCVCMKRKKKVLSTLENLEEVRDEYQVYNNDELNQAENRIELKLPGEGKP